ncbi:MAG: bifunctional 4-hydroxy-3-methylbut-2-enyl diphosphate reductase/30S ribosomal protein S1 [Clostridiales bacterium]|nr:bifunctional 4-hydroxy-3-methylbut-2-enyl diphosphate reductase/30S ribosomal protein S1 [Clostridiales bacterium]
MEILLAHSAGFCFGVSKAVARVNELLDEGRTVYTLGPIIHNPQLVDQLARRGVRIAQTPDEVPEGAVLVIRSHGVPRDTVEHIRELPVEMCDATCPFVSKIHRIAAEQSAKGALLLIAGDHRHPEVIGIRGHCSGPSVVFSSAEELSKEIEKGEWSADHPVAMVSQTTFHTKTWENCVKIAKKHYTNLLVFDTICDATAKRQNEAVELSLKSDIMVIVGGRQSSNTAKLRDVCSANCPTVLIETADELSRQWFEGIRTAGLTAGASTPADIIKEVLSTMSEIEKNNEVQRVEDAAAAETIVSDAAAAAAETADQAEAASTVPAKSFDEMSFEEALEASLQSLSTDERVHGVVVGIAPNEVQVEVVGRKQAGYIPADELSADPNAKVEDLVKVGDELELLIMRTNDQEGTIMLSKKRVDAMKGWDKVVEAEESGAVLEGTVTDVIKGGMLVVTNGVRVFVPASQASAMRMEDLSPLKGTTVRFRIIETNKSRRRAVGSVRQVAREERKEKEGAFWEKAEVGQTYAGVVKSLTSYGAFVDIGGVDGMIHISELSWSRIKHPSEVVNVGDKVEVYIKDLDHEKKKISLGYRKTEDNPWEILKEQYPVGSVVKAKVVGMTTFGAFAQLLPGVDGLIHISQIANHRVEKPQDELKVGEEVTVKITNIDYDKKRISLSIRELLEDVPAEDEGDSETAEEAPAGETEESAE